MKHLDLFSGIGGFALAAEMVWGGSVDHVFCDIDPFSQAILKKHWPLSRIYEDIRTLSKNDFTPYADRAGSGGVSEQPRQESPSDWISGQGSHIDLLTGGFPCQPFSAAGKRLGTEDDRHLWPEMLRVIREFHPRWIIGENVGGFVTWSGGMVLEQVHTDLENEGYEVQSFIIPAVSLNAPHRRDRIWIVAHSECQRGCDGEARQEDAKNVVSPGERSTPNSSGKRRGKRGTESTGLGRVTAIGEANSPAHHASGFGHGEKEEIQTGRNAAVDAGGVVTDPQHESAGHPKRRGYDKGSPTGTAGSNSSAPDSDARGVRRHKRESTAQGAAARSGGSWDQNWTEVAARLCVVDDGISGGVARPRGWRNAALKGAGNAIVPQVAAEIMRAIKAVDE